MCGRCGAEPPGELPDVLRRGADLHAGRMRRAGHLARVMQVCQRRTDLVWRRWGTRRTPGALRMRQTAAAVVDFVVGPWLVTVDVQGVDSAESAMAAAEDLAMQQAACLTAEGPCVAT